MSSVTNCVVAAGISGCFVVDQEGVCRLHSLEEVGKALFGPSVVPVPPELRDRTWPTCAAAVQDVRVFFASR